MGLLSGKFSPGLKGKILPFVLKRFACCLNALANSCRKYQNQKHFSHRSSVHLPFPNQVSPTPDVLQKCLREDPIESVSLQKHQCLTQTLMLYNLALGITDQRAMNVELNWCLWTCEDAQPPLHLLGQHLLGLLSVSVCMCTHLQSIYLFLLFKASTSYKIASSNIYMRSIILWSSRDTCWPCLMHPISTFSIPFSYSPISNSLKLHTEYCLFHPLPSWTLKGRWDELSLIVDSFPFSMIWSDF